MNKRGRNLANIASSYAQQVVYVVVGLLVTRVLVRYLGLGAFGSVYFLIQLGMIVGVVGNALTGAAARYVTQSIARGEQEKASSYLSNTLFAVVGMGVVCVLGFNAYGLLAPKFSSHIPMALMTLVLLSVTISSAAYVLSVGNFIREQFVTRAGANILGKLVYLASLLWLLRFLNAGVWSVGWSLCMGSAVTLVASYFLCRRLLPDVRWRLSLVSRKQVLEIASFVGWMLAAYCGMYVTRSGMLLAIQDRCTPQDLGRFALVFQVSTMILNLLQTFSLVASPAIYRALAVGRTRQSTAGMERYLFQVTLLGAVATVALALEGESVLRLWLAHSAPPGMQMFLVGAGFSAMMLGWGTGMSVFLAGSDRIRIYGIVCLIAAFAVVGGTFVLLWADPQNLVYVSFLPGVAELAKYVVHTRFVDRKSFRLAPGSAYTCKLGELLLVLVPCPVCWWVATAVVPGHDWWQVMLRLTAIAVPMAVHVAWKYRSWLRPAQTAGPVTTSSADASVQCTVQTTTVET